MTYADIARQVYNANPNLLEGTSTIRDLAKALRLSLIDFEKERQDTLPWSVLLPTAKRSDGYELNLRRRDGKLSPTEAFWGPHTAFDFPVFIVCNEPLFFHEPSPEKLFRFADTNQWVLDIPAALRDLKLHHPEAYSDGLTASQIYLFAGEIDAYDIMYEWFLTNADSRLDRKSSCDLTVGDFERAAPILLGNPRINRFIAEFMSTQEGRLLPYRCHNDLFGTIDIEEPTAAELEVLEGHYPHAMHYPAGHTLSLRSNPSGDVFVLITRVKNIFGKGIMTIISTDYNRTLKRVGQLLTDDERLGKCLELVQWQDGKPLPEVFQAIFAVRLGLSSLDVAGRAARLVIARAVE